MCDTRGMQCTAAPKFYTLGLAAVLVVGALAFGYGVYMVGQHITQASAHAGTESSRGTYWESRIRILGAHAAYEEFVRSVAGKDSIEEHEEAHTFGDALYDAMGEAGLAVCDGRASYGCYHAVVGHTIAEKGLGEVGALVRYCHASIGTDPLSCQHGVGHGLVGHFGYDKEDLDKALAVCKDQAVPDIIDSCYSGAIMEYNMRTMLGADATVRPVDGDALAPCDTVAPEYQHVCAFQEPQWWLQVLGKDKTPDAGMYEKLGALCDEMEQELSIRRACYEGLGEDTPAAVQYNPSVAAALCSASSTDTLNQLFCLSYAANGIAERRGQDEGLKVCAALAGTALQYCSAYVTKQASIINPLPAPTL